MAVSGGAVLGGLLLLLVFAGTIWADIAIRVVFNFILILIIAYIYLGIGMAVATIIESIKNKKYRYVGIFLAIAAIVLLIPFENFYDNFLGYKLFPIFHRILLLGIIGWIMFRIYKSEYDDFSKVSEGIIVGSALIMVIALIGVHFSVGIDATIFSSVPQTVAEHNENWYIKKETKDYTPKEELESVLQFYKSVPTTEFSKEEINKLTHTTYNGIWCYAVEDTGDSYEVGMGYKSSGSFLEAIFPSKNFSKVGNYKVDKTSFEITEIIFENFVGGQNYGE